MLAFKKSFILPYFFKVCDFNKQSALDFALLLIICFPFNNSTLSEYLYILCWKTQSECLRSNYINSFKSFLKKCLISDCSSLQFCTGYRESFFTLFPQFLSKSSISCVFVVDSSPDNPCWSKNYEHWRHRICFFSLVNSLWPLIRTLKATWAIKACTMQLKLISITTLIQWFSNRNPRLFW